MKLFIIYFLLSSIQIFSQSYLNILLSNGTYKNSQISDLKKITLSTTGELMYFHLSNGTTATENTANIKKFTFSDTPLGEPLPVELSAFNAIQIGSSVLLKWRTVTEVNNYGFDIERANDLNSVVQQWNKIGFVGGNGNCNSPKDYSFTDNPKSGNKYYYRLKQIDSDGQTEYSNIISAEIKIPVQFALYQNYPNPFNPTTNITYSLPFDGIITVKIYDVLGSEIITLINDHQKAGIYTLPFNGNNLSSGIYICKMTGINFIASIKMTLIK